MFSFQTLKTSLTVEGIGLHSGARVRVEIKPRAECGVIFTRADLMQRPQIPACARHIGSTLHATVLENAGVQISTPEHVLAALWSYGITHADIVVDGPEIPILDGSARPWCDLIEAAQVHKLPGIRPEYCLLRPVAVYERDGCVIGLPHHALRVSTDVEYEVDYLAPQIAACNVSSHSFRDELASARTFTLEKWIQPLRSQNLIRGGTMENALVLGAVAPLSPLRFPDELARHKAIDVLGDISLLFGSDGGVLRAHLIAVRAGHGLHQRWMQEVLNSKALHQSG